MTSFMGLTSTKEGMRNLTVEDVCPSTVAITGSDAAARICLTESTGPYMDASVNSRHWSGREGSPEGCDGLRTVL